MFQASRKPTFNRSSHFNGFKLFKVAFLVLTLLAASMPSVFVTAPVAQAAAGSQSVKPKIEDTVAPAVYSGDLRNLPQIGDVVISSEDDGSDGPDVVKRLPRLERDQAPAKAVGKDTALQTIKPRLAAPPAPANFKGLDYPNFGAGFPPDTNGDVGPNNYIQTVNTAIGIYNKADGVRQVGLSFNSFFSAGGAAAPCSTGNGGDPVVLYDTLADRWIITDFAWTTISTGPFYECIAVSRTGDPVSGGWYFYTYQTSATAAFPDYPKLGIWPDGVYMTDNVFTSSSGSFVNVRVFVLNRSDLESGAALRSVVFNLPNNTEFMLMPSNMRGTPPPVGRENLLVELQSNTAGTLGVRKVHVDWTTPANSTLGSLTTITATPWNELTGNRDVVPQLGTIQKVDPSGGRAMVQNQYRNIGGTESIWVPHTVAVGTNIAAVRWYQLNVTGGTIASTPVQQSTYSPDSNYRFIPSLAVNKNGDMAIGYSVSSASMYPAIRYAGRLAGDAANTLTQDETTLFAGTGAQTGFNRWGDYSGMTVDPTDDCTFWYTTEYNEVTATSWQTRIGKFRLPSCGQTALVSLNVTGPNPSLVGQSLYFTATVTPSPAGVTPTGPISITSNSNVIASGTLDANGQFTFNTSSLPFGTYNFQAVYGGDANYGSGFSSVYTQIINSTATPVIGQGGLTCDQAGLDAALAQAGYITFQCPNPTTISVSAAFLSNRTISNTTTLDGSVNSQNITIDGGSSTVPFQVTPSTNFTIKGLTIANGQNSTSGGGILNQGNLTVISSTFRTNAVPAANGGGGIFSSGNLTVTNTTFKSNNGGNVGGAIYATGSTTNISNSTIDTNTAKQGGGVNIIAGTANISGNTFVSNSATGDSGSTGGTQGLGGGLIALGTTNLVNNTFTTNTSGYRGGAIWLNTGTLTVSNDTIVNNSTVLGGGGIRNNGGTVNVANTIVANNTSTANPNIYGPIISQDYN